MSSDQPPTPDGETASRGAVTPGPSRGTLRLTPDCNNHCVFCAQDATSPLPVDFGEQLEALRREHEELTLIGGEPTLLPNLHEIVAQARRVGFSRIGVQTNGRRLCDAAYAGDLARAGLTDVHLSLHGATAEVHDYHTGVSGSYDGILGAMRSTRSFGLTLVAATVVTRSNFRVLAGFPDLLAACEVSAWLLVMPHAVGAGYEAFDRVVPRLALVAPFLLQAASLARTRRVPTWIRGAPHCLLGPFSRWTLERERRDFGARCASCQARATCSGVDASYLERFGDGELLPLGELAGAPSPDSSPLSRLFVGTGPMRALPLGSPGLGPAALHRALPMLGKVRPGLQEASRGTPKRTGDELRQILPQLFSEGDD
ncbi:MAG TPA: radical SAM protein [Polyangiaceae bacterium]|nr:radical SAM protein [Polyangiaceae bacterium]